MIWGNKSSSKSSMLLQSIGLAQQQGKSAAWIDAEDSYDSDWAEELGVDNKEIVIAPIKTIGEMGDKCVELMNVGFDIIVVDSISALNPSGWFEDDEFKGMSKTKQIGTKAKELGVVCNVLNYTNENTALIFISQVRNALGAMHAYQIPDGGHAVTFFSTTIVKLTSSHTQGNQISGVVWAGDKVFKQAVAREVNWEVQYNKIGPPSDQGSYIFNYKGENKGVDNVAEVIDLAERFDIIKKATGWYTIEGEKYQGKSNAANALRAEPDLLAEIEKKIYDYV